MAFSATKPFNINDILARALGQINPRSRHYSRDKTARKSFPVFDTLNHSF